MKSNLYSFFIVIFLFFISGAEAQRIMEKLDRGVVAINKGSNNVYIGWRLLASDPGDVSFNVYSSNGGSPVKLNAQPVTNSTNLLVTLNTTAANTIFVKPIIKGIEGGASKAFVLKANPKANRVVGRIPLKPFTNSTGYQMKFAWPADLNGDGEYDVVCDRQNYDNTNTYPTPRVEAYTGSGVWLWQINVGPNVKICDGQDDMVVAYDMNGDNKAEVMLHTSEGTVFGNGVTIGDSNSDGITDYRGNTTKTAPHFISIVDGLTGIEIDRIETPNKDMRDKIDLMNGVRNTGGEFVIAYLDGIHPSLCEYYQNRNADGSHNIFITGWDFKNNKLVERFNWRRPSNAYFGGFHQISVSDVDGDGKDEIIQGGYVLDDTGLPLFDTELVHGDRHNTTDIDPERPGLETFGIQQYNPTTLGMAMYDASNGQMIKRWFQEGDLGRGLALDMDPSSPGMEVYSTMRGVYNSKGDVLYDVTAPFPSEGIYWDADLGREILAGIGGNGFSPAIEKWNPVTKSQARLVTLYHEDGQYSLTLSYGGRPGFIGDYIGDWREELIVNDETYDTMLIVSTWDVTDKRIYCLMQNPAYRGMATTRGYYQSPYPDFYLGYDMVSPPIPSIQKANKYWMGNTLIWDTSTTNWTTGASNSTYADGDTVMFDIRGNNADTVKINNTLSPGRVWMVNPTGKNYTLAGSGKLSGLADVIKILPGTITLCGNHDYTGKTQISEGTLIVNGKLNSKVIVQSKGNLGGSATLNGGIELEQGLNSEGGRVSPGNGCADALLGSLIIQGNVSVPGKNNFAFDIVPGSAKINDSILVKGNFTFTGSNKLIITFKNDLPVAGVYPLINCTGTLTATQDNFTIEGLAGVLKKLIITANQVKLEILTPRTPGSLVWKGTIDNKWDFDKTNFDLKGSQAAFTPKDTLLFDQSGAQKSIVLTEKATVSKLTFDATSDYTVDGPGIISGTGDFVKLNSNTVSIVSSKNTYTGKTIVNGGTLAISKINFAGDPSSIGSASADPANIQLTDASLVINDQTATDRGMTVNGVSTINIPSATNYAAIRGVIAGSGKLIKDGNGQLTITNKNTFPGGTILKKGTILLASFDANNTGLGTGSITLEGGTLSMSDVRDNNVTAWNLIVPAGATATFNADGRCSINGTLTGSGTLNINSPYVRTDFNGNWSAFTGQLNISGGDPENGNDFRIGNSFGYANASINLLKGIAYTYNNKAVSFGELSGVASSSISGTNWTIGAKNTDATFNGTIVGNTITKVGTGAWTVTGANTYTGTTTVNGGKLIVNNTTGSGTGTGAVAVNNTGTLSGTGKITGTVTVNNGGTIAPGNNAIGTLTINNTVTLATGSTTLMEINQAGNTNDQIVSTGTVKINGTLKLVKTDGGSFSAGGSYKLFNATTITGKFTAIDPALPWDTTALRSTGIISLNGVAQSISFATLPTDKKFGDAPFNLSVTGGPSGNPVVLESLNPSVITISGAQVSILSAGSAKIKASQAGNATHITATPVEQTLQIAKAQLTVKGPDTSKVAGTSNPKFVLKYIGLVNDNKPENLEVKPVATCVANSGSPAGDYPIVVSKGSDKNYNFNYINGTLKVIAITSAENDLKEGMTIYPNPTGGKVRITFEKPAKQTTVVVENINGGMVHSSNNIRNSSFVEVDLSSFVSGIYFIKMNRDGQIVVNKIFKK